MSAMNQTADGQQAALWNGVAGRAWVDSQDLIDRMFAPFADMLVERVKGAGGGRVLDVGCGTGGTTLAVARELGGKVDCVGVDISEPMISAACARAVAEGLPVRFLAADAEVYPLERGWFDVVVSRFGVMFFSDPVRAFANLRGAVRKGGELHVAVWRDAEENAFMTAAERAARPLLPKLPERKVDGPGQFAFADRGRVEGILRGAGWEGVEIRPADVECTFPQAELNHYLTRLGPVGVALAEADERTRATVSAVVRAAFEPYVVGTEVRFNAACWMVSARAWS